MWKRKQAYSVIYRPNKCNKCFVAIWVNNFTHFTFNKIQHGGVNFIYHKLNFDKSDCNSKQFAASSMKI